MIKNIIGITIAVVVSAASIYVLVNKASVQAATLPEKDCMRVYDVAADIMMQRQNIGDLRGMLEAVRGDEGRTIMVKEAFKLSKMNLPENRDKYVKQFAEEMWQICEEN